MTQPMQLPCYVAGAAVASGEMLKVHNPYDGSLVGSVATARTEDVGRAIDAALAAPSTLTRHERYEVLERARRLLQQRTAAFGELISRESGLCVRETTYEVSRSVNVLQFAAIEALRDDGQIFSCDVTEGGKQRKIFTHREPVALAAAITPFNHPLNQVVHKVAPAVAAGAPLILKPSERTPLTAIHFALLLYEAGLPPAQLSVLLGPHAEVAEPLVTDPRVEVVSFTGSVAVGKRIAGMAGYKRLVLELGGNSPLLILADADLELAVHLAAEGCYRNSGQRCTAVKRLLVHEAIAEEFTRRLVEKTAEYTVGDPADPATRVGTVIDESAATQLEVVVERAVAAGARVLCGGGRRGAQLEPTVIADVPRDADLVVHESFGPLAPVLDVRDVDDAIALANATAFGLSAGVVTNNLDHAIRAVRGIRTGTVNVNEIPGFRLETTPFGGVKDSGLGIKEGVVEAIKSLTTVKTFSLPW